MKKQISSEGILAPRLTPRGLTKREKEIVRFVAQGYKNNQIAEKLGISSKTVATHRAHVMNKLALRNAVQRVHYAIQKGFIKIEG